MEEFVPEPPRVVPYDRAWATSYKKEARLLGIALAPVPHWVESSVRRAVPGLPAKPVIDLMVGVVDYGRFHVIRQALGTLGYIWDPAAERDEPARKIFRKGPPDFSQRRTHHLHLAVKDGDYWRRILAFRDQLRQDPSAAAEYADVKADLLRACGDDSHAYTRGKRDVVKKIERTAGVDVP